MKKIVIKIAAALALSFVVALGCWILPSDGQAREAKAATPTGNTVADVYLIGGQSNASGSSNINCTSTGLDNTNFSLKFPAVRYVGQTHPTTAVCIGEKKSMGRIIDDFRPTQQGLGGGTNQIGPELGMAAYLQLKYEKTSTDAIIIKSASGGTPLLTNRQTLDDPDATYTTDAFDAHGSWYPESLWQVKDGEGNPVDLWTEQYYYERTGYSYRRFVDFVKTQYVRLKDMGYTTINFRALCWMQGESDSGNPTLYKQVFGVFCEDIRKAIGEISGQNESALPVVIGEVSETFWSYESKPTNLKFIAMQDKLPYSIQNAYVVDTGRYQINADYGVLGSDRYHWNYADMIEIGQQFGRLAYEAEQDPRWLFVEETGVSGTYNPGGEKPNGSVLSPLIHTLSTGEGELVVKIETELKYEIGGLTYRIGDGAPVDALALMRKRIENGKREFELTIPLPAGEEDAHLAVRYCDAPSYEAIVSVEGKDWGDRIYSSSYDKTVYEGSAFRFTALPKEGGEVKKITVNDVEIEYENKNDEITIDNILQYLNGETKLSVLVTYGESEKQEPVPPLTPEEPPLTPENPPDPSSGCAAQAGRVLALVCALCAAVFVFRKIGG